MIGRPDKKRHRSFQFAPGRSPPGSAGGPLSFETLGNATIQFVADGRPILATDPWLVGTCYFGSWALDHALSDEQICNVQNSEFIWISHGHPDHLHHESLRLIPKGKTILVPDHYDHEIADFLRREGFSVEILKYRKWRRLHPQLEVLCLDNENQDAILIARFGDALVINLNDSPYYGEFRFIRQLVAAHPNEQVFVLQLCSIDADMRNFVDSQGKRVIDPPEMLKPGAIWAVAREAEKLGARYFCCSSSQHLYVRANSEWANSYRITFEDLLRHWNRPNVALVPPFVTMNVSTGTYVENHPSRQSDYSQITNTTGDDDWDEVLSAQEWSAVEKFFGRLKLLKQSVDFIDVSVGGETRRNRISYRQAAWRGGQRDGITLYVPRQSLLSTIQFGYFDDLLIGNFMRTQLHGRADLYPDVTPVISKLAGNAKVYNHQQYRKFRWRYFSRNPFGYVQWRLGRFVQYKLAPQARRWAARVGLFAPLKVVYRHWYLRDPIVESMPPAKLAPIKIAGPTAFANVSQPIGKQVRERPEFFTYDRPRLVISIDTEEDFDWSAPLSEHLHSVHSMGQQYLAQQIFERFRARPIYLCDFPIAQQEVAYRTLREWVADGRCAVGAQLHPWVNPPHLEIVNSHNSYPCNLPMELQRAKLLALTEQITETIGVRPTVYKAGRHGAGSDVADLLKPLNYLVDMSINPIRDYRREGGPNHTTYPHTPFWFDDEHKLLEIPLGGDVLGALRRHWVTYSDFVWSEPAARFGLTSALRHMRLINRIALTPEGMPLEEVKDLTRFLLDCGYRVFALWYHSTSLTPGSTPYVRDAADLSRFLGWLEDYLEFFMGELGGISALPEEVYRDALRAPVVRN